MSEYLIVGGLLYVAIRNRRSWRQKSIQFVARQSRRLMKWYGFEVTYKYSDPHLFKKNKNYFMVCNHMSYMDIILLSAGEPSVFVTSVEMKQTPFLGQCAQFGGSYFVERRKRTKIPIEIQDLARLLKEGFHVFVFPEATSHHGLSLLPFKKSMFSAAIEAGVDILPVCLRYEEVNNEPFQQKNHHRICWYDKMPFLPHFLQLVRLRSVKATIEYLEPLSTSLHPDRASLAQNSYEMIAKSYFANRPPEFQIQR